MDGLTSPGEIRTAVKMSQASHDLHPVDCGPSGGGEGRGGAEKMVGMQSDGEQESEREREKESAGGNA